LSTVTTSRVLDDGGPFALWASEPNSEEAHPHCRHGIWVEPELDGAGESLPLRLRAAERVSTRTANVETEGVRVVLSLSTGACIPADAPAADLLARSPWILEALGGRIEWLRERVARATAQREQLAPSPAALERAEPGAMIPYDYLFPAAWDLILQHDGHTYWAVDHHCPNPACDCANVVVAIHRTDSPHAQHVGEIRLDLRHAHKPRASSPQAARIFERFWVRYGDEIIRRHTHVRQSLPRASAPARLTVSASTERVPRNAPCPCGSGKKFKRCCLGRSPSLDPE
jgi:uncharacterized protein YchJ